MTQPENTPALEAEQSESGAVCRPGVVTYDGKPCKHCGATRRYSSNHKCVGCKAERERERRHRDPDYAARRRESTRRWHAKARASNPAWVEGRRAKERAAYEALDHIAYNERRLKERRRHALRAKEKRHGSISDEG